MCTSRKKYIYSICLVISFFVIIFFIIKNYKKDTCFDDDINLFSFTVAGHVYGNPWGRNQGLYKPFQKYIDICDVGDFVILTGDVFREVNKNSVENIFYEFNQKNIQFYLTPGNHELTGLGMDYIKDHLNYKKNYYSWDFKGFHFISIDSNQIKSDAQFDFLKKDLEDLEEVDGIFVFMHNIYWYEEFKVTPNNKPSQEDVTFFYESIIPLFKKIN